jgi:hypothetical protein
MSQASVARAGSGLGSAQSVLGRLPFTLMLTTALLLFQELPRGTRSNADVVSRFGINWHTLANGQMWRLVTDMLVQGAHGLRWSIMIPFLWVGVAEWHLGWRRTATTFFVTDWISTISTLSVLRVASTHSHWSAQQIARFDSGSSAAIYGTLAAFCASRRGPNSWVAPVLLVQSMVTIWLTNRRLFDVQHLVAIAVGLVLGAVFGRNDRRAEDTLGHSS